MEIKTCEGYVLDRLQTAEERVTELEIELEVWKNEAEKFEEELAQAKLQAELTKAGEEDGGKEMTVEEAAKIMASLFGDDMCCCNYNEISDDLFTAIDNPCEVAGKRDGCGDLGVKPGTGCWEMWIRLQLKKLRGEARGTDGEVNLDHDGDKQPLRAKKTRRARKRNARVGQVTSSFWDDVALENMLPF